MAIQFSKMQSLGNDFVVIDAMHQNIDLSPAEIRHMAARRFGIGFDQLLIVGPTDKIGCDFSYRIF
ncbi:MAG TPA: diaminopimelate epimerase, partial [Coxiellaceae bacterium]|nr:diaminopimelate epimerase [Coxiellaceae bacterium]